MWIKTGLAILAGYLIGSIPFSYLFARWLKGIDIRKFGTKNVGAANVYLCCGILPFMMAVALDVGKGAAAVAIAKGLSVSEIAVVTAGIAAIIGHIRPLYLSFNGGKGIATTCGVLVSLIPQELFIALGIWIAVVVVWRYATLAGLIAGSALPLLVWHFSGSKLLVISSAVMMLLLGLMTISSIKGLFAGTAPKIGQNEIGQRKNA